MSEWIVIPGWDRFQHYKDRRPPWIKVYTELRDKDEWLQLTLAEQGLLVNIWMAYAASDGLLRVPTRSADDPQTSRTRPLQIPQKIRRKSFERLRDAGFIELVASKPLAHRYQVASPETETETEKKSIKKVSKPKTKSLEQKAQRWLDATATELVGVDIEYVLRDEFEIDDPVLLADLVAYAQERWPR